MILVDRVKINLHFLKREVVIAVLLSALLLTGAGQLYNRDWKKAIILLVLPFLLVVSLVMGVRPILKDVIPSESSISEPFSFRELSEKIKEANPPLYSTFQLLMMATWMFGVVDAYLGARDRQKRILSSRRPPPEGEE